MKEGVMKGGEITMKVTRTFTLERPARSNSGDRYEEQVPSGEQTIMGQTYVNQNVSRALGSPAKELIISIENKYK